MEMPQSNLDRIVFAELARKSAEADHAGNPHDADNLTKWGTALMELSNCQDGDGCVRMLEDAVSKLEAALRIDPGKHEALYVLGNAFTARGFYNQDAAEARVYFDKATECFLEAVQEDPENGNYLSALNMASQAPKLHQEMQRQRINEQASRGGSSASNTKASKKKQAKAQKKNSEFRYDVLGWVIFAAGLATWMRIYFTQPPPPPPSW